MEYSLKGVKDDKHYQAKTNIYGFLNKGQQVSGRVIKGSIRFTSSSHQSWKSLFKEL
tara:strand:- start:11134 stop:11304 length:171 start_codon:yes stop_codon:yes gene_type:complete